jgi:uncharacterized protein
METISRSPRARKRVGMRVIVFSIVGASVGATLIYVGISLCAADRLTRPTNRPSAMNLSESIREAQRWSTLTEDGLTLRGWYLPTDRRRQLIVMVHGLWGSWEEDMLDLGIKLHNRHFDVLLFDLRGHGESDPSRLSMGFRERADIRAVQLWAESQGFSDQRIGWVGYSMGGALLLLEAARNRSIRVAVTDSAYGDLHAVLRTQLSKESGLWSCFNPGIIYAAQLCYGLPSEGLDPIRFSKDWGERPLLLIHGVEDSVVPISQARELELAMGASCELYSWKDAGHIESYKKHKEEYVRKVGDFFDDHLGP